MIEGQHMADSMPLLPPYVLPSFIVSQKKQKPLIYSAVNYYNGSRGSALLLVLLVLVVFVAAEYITDLEKCRRIRQL